MTTRLIRFSAITLASAALAAAAAVLIIWKGLPPSPSAIVVTVVVPVTMAVAGFVALRAGRDWQLAYALSMIATAVAVVAAEAFLDFMFLPRQQAELRELVNQRSTLLAQQGMAYRSQGEEWPYTAGCSFAHPRCNYVEPGPSDHPALLPVRSGRVVPLGGISGVRTVFCNEGSGLIVYDADEHGFNNPQGLWSQAPLDVLLVGDSYTHGACVEREDTFAATIRQVYPKTISIGIGGNGPILELAGLREYGPTLRPKVVVWVFTIDNDFSDFERESQNSVLRAYLDGEFSQKLLSRQAEIDDGLKSYFRKVMVERLISQAQPVSPAKAVHIDTQIGSIRDFFSLASLRRLLGVYFSWPVRDYQGVGDVLSKAKVLTESWGGRMIVVFQPSSYSFIGFNRFDGISDMLQKDFARTVAQLDLPYVDGLAILRSAEARQPVFWGLGSHTTPWGYQALGAAIRDKVGQIVAGQDG